MLDAENEIGEDLLKFGVHVREATQLMQAQITAAFTGEEATVPSVAPGSRVRRAVVRCTIFCTPFRRSWGGLCLVDIPIQA